MKSSPSVFLSFYIHKYQLLWVYTASKYDIYRRDTRIICLAPTCNFNIFCKILMKENTTDFLHCIQPSQCSLDRRPFFENYHHTVREQLFRKLQRSLKYLPLT